MMLCSIRAIPLSFIFILTETRILRTPLETRIYEPSSYTCRDGETESRDVVWAAGHAGAVGEGWQGRGDCAVAGDNETLLLFSAGGVFKGHQLPRLHRARRQRWQDRGEESFSGRGAVACSACSLLLAAGGCVILQLIFSIKSIESVPDSVCPHPWPVAGIFTTIYLSMYQLHLLTSRLIAYLFILLIIFCFRFMYL